MTMMAMMLMMTMMIMIMIVMIIIHLPVIDIGDDVSRLEKSGSRRVRLHS